MRSSIPTNSQSRDSLTYISNIIIEYFSFLFTTIFSATGKEFADILPDFVMLFVVFIDINGMLRGLSQSELSCMQITVQGI